MSRRAAHALSEDRAQAAKEAEFKAQIKGLLAELADANTRNDRLMELKKCAKPLKRIEGPRKGRVLGRHKRVATAVALASDWHVEEIVNPIKVMGLNEFNPKIAELRAKRFFEGIEWLIREQQSLFSINHLVLWLGGDFISGYIHEELVEANAMSPTRALTFAFGLIEKGIQFLLDTTELELRIPCNFGNHGRTTLKRRIATAADNSFEYLMYTQLAGRFKNETRVQFSVCEGLHHVTEIYDLRMHTHHGDDVRSLGGIGGVQVPLKRAAIQWQRKFNAHLSCVGHFHEYMSGEDFVMNGSLIGYGMYSDSLAGAQNKPAQQAFFLVDSKRGKTQCSPLWVQQ